MRTLITVIPAKAGTQRLGPSKLKSLGPRLRGDDGKSTGRLLALILLLALLPLTVLAQPASDPTPLQFTDTAQERRFHALVAELRCVMCQNQSLADSNAQIAVDLRREVLELMQQGNSDAEIKAFLVARYGEFVLYRPQVESKTWLLWFGPAVLLLAGGIVAARIVHKRGGTQPVASDNDQEW